MRTTLAIDDDLFEKLREASGKQRISIARLVNELLRHSLSGQCTTVQPRPAFRVEVFESEFQPEVRSLHLNRLADDIDIEERHKPRSR